LVLCARLIHLQVHLSKKLYSRGQKNFLRINKIQPTRGNIVDINGKLLATNKPIHNLYWTGKGKPTLSEKDLDDLYLLERIIGKQITDEETLEKIKIANKYNKKFLIAAEITFEQLSKIEEQFDKNSSILIETSFKRFYPYQSFASHTLGFLGRMDINNMGKMGLEKLLEGSLKGKDGAMAVKINSFGTQLSQTIVQNSLAGKNIKINLDIELQEIIENAYPKDSTGCFILMDPCDGSVLALLSKPNFDPNIFLSPISKPEWDELQENNPFLNRAFDATYPPGSIFKLVTMSLALENKIVTQNDTCHCCGYLTFAGRKYYCHNHDGHGLLNAQQVFEQSCDIFFYKIAKKMDIDHLANYANRFGLGQKTNIIFPEKLGIIPTKAWKKKNMGERWYTGESLSASIGQSFITVTPMQAARMASSVYTGYLVNPRILEQEPIIKSPLNISNATLKFLRQSMKGVVTHGTARSINRNKDFEIYAKTATAQTSDLTKRDLGERIYREHKWLIGTFKYKNNKPITFVVLVEHAESPTVTKEAANYLLTEYKKLMDKKETDKISCMTETKNL
jgi:penicillin-binding protein 2